LRRIKGFFFFFLIFRTVEAGKKTCFCDLRVDNLVNSKVIQDLHDDRIGSFFRGCRYASDNCSGECWYHSDKAAAATKDNQDHLDAVCKRLGLNPSGYPIVGYVKVSNCGTHNSKNYHKKLCCKQHEFVLPNGQVVLYNYGEMC